MRFIGLWLFLPFRTVWRVRFSIPAPASPPGCDGFPRPAPSERHGTAPVALGMEVAFIESLECFSTEEQIYRDDTCLCFNTFKHLDSSNFKVNKFQDRLDYFFLKFSFLINYFLYK